MSKTKLIIAIEGIDACGKGTQTDILREKLQAYSLHFPNYATPTGQLILKMLKGARFVAEDVGNVDYDCYRKDDEADALALQALMLANRYEIMPEITARLRHVLFDDGPQDVIFDRYHVSGLVYGHADGLSMEWLVNIHQLLPKPDLSIFIDISVEESFKRRPQRTDKYESDAPRLQRVRELYTEYYTPTKEQGQHLYYVDHTSHRNLSARKVMIDGGFPVEAIAHIIANEVETTRMLIEAAQAHA